MKIGCTSLKLSRLNAVQALFQQKLSYIMPFLYRLQRVDYDIYCGWGYSKQSIQAKKIADKNHKKFLYLEDGFIRSVFTSSVSKEPLSLVMDTVAPYYDYQYKTDLEQLIHCRQLTLEEKDTAIVAKDYFLNNKLSKFCFTEYPHGKKIPKDFNKDSLLIIDQVFGDLSLVYGGVTAHTPHQLYDYIQKNYPKNQTIYLKLHPEVLNGKRKGCFDFIHHKPNIICITECDLSDLLVFKPNVFVLTSLAGFEATLYDCNVFTFGLPWYGGYGITQDMHPLAPAISRRRGQADILTIFYAAYLEYTQYVNPVSKKKTNYFDTVQFIARVVRHQKMMSRNVIAIGIRPWKRKDIYPWLKTPKNHIVFLEKKKSVLKALQQNPYSKIICWSYKNPKIIEAIKQKFPQTKIIRLEDGFIRSYGLGSDFIPPLSLCFDNKDLYFNAISNNPSDLKNILKQSTNSFFLERAKKLQEKIIHHHITKYNTDIITPIDVPDSKHIIFVAGQVTHDASLVYGDLPPHIQQDYDLLKQVKEDYPESYILYKPHPDTMTGNRKHGDKYHLCHHFYNQIETQASVLSCISVANLIVTMTSQVGFDALVRRKKVKAYGSPFYKDFSDDIEEKPKSSLSLEHLIYSALIEYPLYHNGKSFIMPEDAVDMIIARKNLLEKSYRYTIMQLKLFKFLYKVKKWVF